MEAPRHTSRRSLSTDWHNIFKKVTTGKPTGLQYLPLTKKFKKRFCTGSSYIGKWNALGMAVYGTYTFASGCKYTGGFEDGMFHGEGLLTYPMGQRMKGFWHRGKMLKLYFYHVDFLESSGSYCKFPDRRFAIELGEGLNAAGRENLTNQRKERFLPEGCYDTADGYYVPETKCVLIARSPEDYETKGAPYEDEEWGEEEEHVEEKAGGPIRKPEPQYVIVSQKRESWIMKHCRKGWDESAGYRPEFYEHWVSGREAELEQIEEQHEKMGRYEIHGEEKLNEHEEVHKKIATPIIEYAKSGRQLMPGTASSLLFLNVDHKISE